MADFTELNGTWNIDAAHSRLGFAARHAMISKVRGEFAEKEGGINIDGANPNNSSVKIVAKTESFTTENEMRDKHVRSGDFLDTENYPEMSFESTKVEVAEGTVTVTGNLTIKATTKEVEVELDWAGPVKDPMGNERIGFEGSFVINRQDYGVSFSAPMETGGILVADKITVNLDIEATRA
ncbi:polyisoprenoid-binding protein YceI [Arcanobacterium wilhelmae]|uniref:Polyisoprenoid-binding protein YceI n=1 Tax=Arcanobacterium wilhelmae TaxID=1803177 RepID=A0ABT9NAX3_9ACTO|nr:YceI family protein [Arcanobacterium wilhelmae]MDP9800640.1 polyisoprenoid-binding protein YceI [Arcanobacterium wilhelmae]WFN90046.1 YceI family protein [Arcanobacterium wilhelmae]